MITIIIRVYAFVPSEFDQWDLGPQSPYTQPTNKMKFLSLQSQGPGWNELSKGPGGHPDELRGHWPFISFSTALQCQGNVIINSQRELNTKTK